MLKRARKFARARDGLAAVEFALIAPVMMLMFFGAAEMSSAIDCKARVGRSAYASADLVAQSTAVTASDMTNVYAAAGWILYPYSSSPATIVISSLVDDGNGATTVAWSKNQGGAARTPGSTVSVPTGLVAKGSGGSVILAEVTYKFLAPVPYFLPNGIVLESTFYARPRRSATVKFS